MDALLMPPLASLAFAAAGALLWRRRPRLARWLVSIAALSLALLSLPAVSGALLRSLQSAPALDASRLDSRCGAIVVLAGDANTEAPEFGGPTCGPLTLERLRYASRLARETGLPVLTSGGPPQRGVAPHAELMKAALERDFAVPVRWTETRSSNTRENAAESARILREAGIERAYVVTHAWHVARAVAAFSAEGFETVPAPTGFRARFRWDSATFVPSAKALRESSWALHEWLGRAWYSLSE